MLSRKLFMKEANCRDIVQCAYNLSELELEVYKKLLEMGPSRSDDVSTMLNKNRSTVYRSLQKLISCGICYRETKSLEQGGYFHLYVAIDKEALRKKMMECVDEWKERIDEAISRFDMEF